jgi:hypothetical protein
VKEWRGTIHRSIDNDVPFAPEQVESEAKNDRNCTRRLVSMVGHMAGQTIDKNGDVYKRRL